MIRIARDMEAVVIGQPGTGMGYQRVDMRLADHHEIKDVVVFNAEEMELPDDCAEKEIEEIWPISRVSDATFVHVRYCGR